MSADLATLAIQVDATGATQQIGAFGTRALAAADQANVLESAAGGLERGMARLRIVAGLGLFGFKFLSETIEAQDAMAQLEAGVRSTGMAAGFTATQLAAQAGAMEALTTFSDEAIEKTQGVLLLFERLGGVNFERATQSAADLASRMGEDIPSAARVLGKALEDPVTGFQSLRRAGIIFTESQKQMITALMLTGQEAKAQTAILDILDQKIGGSAAAARDTLGGALKGLAHDFGNLFEVSRNSSSALITVIAGLSAAFRTLNEHGKALGFTLAVMASTIVSKQLVALVAFNGMLRQSQLGTIMAAEAQVTYTESLVRVAVATEEAAQWELALAKHAMSEAVIFQNLAYDIEYVTAAKLQMAAATERLALAEANATITTIRLTTAQQMETVAVANLGKTTLATGGLIAQAGTLAAKGWALIGGPIGAAIIAAIALNSLLDRWIEKQEKANEQTDAQAKATEGALATERKRNAAIRQREEAEESARVAAAKANLERDAETEKLARLNGAYRQSTLSLKLLDIALTANIEKVKVHKDVKQAEWGAIDASIDAQAREQAIAAKRADQLSREEQLRSTQRGDSGAVRAAKQELELSKATAAESERKRINLAYENALYEARLDFAEKTLRATDAQVATAQAEYDSSVKRAKALRDISAAQLEVNERLAAEAEQLQLNAQYAADKDAKFAEGLAKMDAAQKQADGVKDRATALVTDFFHAAAGSATSFWESFRLSAERAFAEIGTKKLIQKMLDIPQIAALFSDAGGAGGTTMGISNSVMSPEMLAKAHPESALGGMIKTAGAGLAMAGAGFGVGQMIGGQTTNRALGALGGAAGGAATGAAMGAMGGPIGVIAGGIIGAGAGLIGGFLGASHAADAAAKALKAMEKAQLEIAVSLASWRAQITGTAADQKAAAVLELRMKYLNIIADIERLEAGKKMEQQREKDLAEAAELYGMAQKKLTETTNDLNEAFTGMIGAVSGYKLNLALFNNAPALGPAAVMPPTTNGAGNTTGGGSPSGDGTPIVVQLIVDGKVLAKSTVNALRKVAQSQLGSSDQLVEAMTLL